MSTITDKQQAAVLAAVERILARWTSAGARPAPAIDRDFRETVFADIELDDDSLSVADILRVRVGKYLARRLPAETLRDRTKRRQLREEIREAVLQALGDATTRSRYLDP